MRIVAGIIMDIDTGKDLASGHIIYDLTHHVLFLQTRAIPDPVIIRLAVKPTATMACCCDIANK
jgi:hypothetical protein